MVQSFYFVVCHFALVVVAVLLLAEVNAVVDYRGAPATVCRVVVVGTVFRVVFVWIRARDRLEPLQVHVVSALSISEPKLLLQVLQDVQVVLDIVA